MATEPLDFASLLAAAGSTAWDRLPAGAKIGHVHLHVGELARAREFYHEQLGLDITVARYPGALFLSAGGYHHHLGTNVWSSAPPAAEDEARLLAWELVVATRDDAARAAASLERAGHAADEKDGMFEVADPWGTRVRLNPES
jgi:catechol 2,3-dioxygenase